MEAGNIKPINYSSVHKICSGQVVLTLATAIKELVENSLDAGATIIEVKLKEYGSELVEVIDNGKGVKTSDFQSITLKHHTSKINDFSDVESVSTFGFRGEALSSLCALSDVEIITCHSDSNIGTLLVYDHNGALVKSSPTPRQMGTSVILRKLFYTLPVRHKEFLKNIRREYVKMIHLLTAYCLISVKKRITCTNTSDKGRKAIVLSTNSNDTVKENISCIFGSKQVSNLMEFVQHAPSESVMEEYFLSKSFVEKCDMFRIEGYISSSTHGEGRSSADRQFFFINGRPCDLPKVSKLINEIYHSFNKSQYPFIFLNITLTEGSVDVNVTPDKRQIFLPHEKLLLCIVKSSLHQIYQLQPSQMKISSISLSMQKNTLGSLSQKLSSETEKSQASASEVTEDTLKRKISSTVDDDDADEVFSSPFKSMRKESDCNSDSEDLRKSHTQVMKESPDSGIGENASPSIPNEVMGEEPKPSSSEVEKNNTIDDSTICVKPTLSLNEERTSAKCSGPNPPCFDRKSLESFRKIQSGGKNDSLDTSGISKRTKTSKKTLESNERIVNYFNRTITKRINDCRVSKESAPSVDSTTSSYSFREVLIPDRDAGEFEKEDALDEPLKRKKRVKTITFDMQSLKESLNSKVKKELDENLVYRKFRSQINPTDNQSAEDELRKEIKKENFSEMSIIGQFNLGFIIARLNDDLFIIDQHATDEKYNFETLQKEVVLETQKLLNPLNLNLPAASEAILLDNLHIFEKSGFKFNTDEDNSIGKKIQLISVPVSHNWRFGKEDVDEMIFMLTDNPVSMVRPSKVNQMFASRACRKSVMIGTALTTSMMKKLVVHMGEIEQPWNCPHGRPTMRHLFNLNLLKTVPEE